MSGTASKRRTEYTEEGLEFPPPEEGQQREPVKRIRKTEVVTTRPEDSEEAHDEKEDEDEEEEAPWQENDEGDLYMDLKSNGTRRVTIRKYMGRVGVDIREYYKDKTTGQMKPGKKGIYLTREQYDRFKELTRHLDEQVLALEREV